MQNFDKESLADRLTKLILTHNSLENKPKPGFLEDNNDPESLDKKPEKIEEMLNENIPGYKNPLKEVLLDIARQNIQKISKIPSKEPTDFQNSNKKPTNEISNAKSNDIEIDHFPQFTNIFPNSINSTDKKIHLLSSQGSMHSNENNERLNVEDFKPSFSGLDQQAVNFSLNLNLLFNNLTNVVTDMVINKLSRNNDFTSLNLFKLQNMKFPDQQLPDFSYLDQPSEFKLIDTKKMNPTPSRPETFNPTMSKYKNSS